MSKKIQSAVIHFSNGFTAPDIHKDIECVNFDPDFIEVIYKDSDSSSTYPTWNVLKVGQYWEEVE